MQKLFILTLLIFTILLSYSPVKSQISTFERQITQKIVNRSFVFNLVTLDSLWYTQNIQAKSVASEKMLDSALIVKRLKEIKSFIDIRYTPEVHNFIEFYAETNRKNVEIMLGLSNYYQPVFDIEIERNKLPSDLRYFPMSMSAMNANAVSENGAVGVWQLLYPTARIYNLHVSTFVDERRMTEKSSRVAVNYLKEMYSIYHDWTLALAAYSSSPAVVNRAINRAGGKRNFWEIYPFLPENSREYIPAYIAILYLVNNYSLHNIKPVTIDLWIPSDTARIEQKLHLMQVSEYLSVSIDTLQWLNPQFRHDIIHPEDKYSYITLPETLKNRFTKSKKEIYLHNDSIYIKPQAKVVEAPKDVKPSTRSSRYTPPSTKDKAKLIYTVKDGDNVGFIASWYNVKVTDLNYWNDIYRNRIFVGDELEVYVPQNKATTYSKINTMTFEEKQKLVGKSTKTSSTTIPSNNNTSKNTTNTTTPTTTNNTTKNASEAEKLDPAYEYYKVKSGDNLWTIAKKYEGITHDDLLKINNFSAKHTLYPGEYVKIRKKK